jgi:hypothetical protein
VYLDFSYANLIRILISHMRVLAFFSWFSLILIKITIMNINALRRVELRMKTLPVCYYSTTTLLLWQIRLGKTIEKYFGVFPNCSEKAYKTIANLFFVYGKLNLFFPHRVSLCGDSEHVYLVLANSLHISEISK